MKITQGDFVRPNNPGAGLPLGSVWRVVCSAGALKLEPENAAAQRVERSALAGLRFPAQDFDKVVWYREQWVSARDAELLSGPTWFFGDDVPTDRMASPAPQSIPQPVLTSADAVIAATDAAEQAARRTAAVGSLLEDARKLEAERKEELRAAKAAKAKADKVAAARAKADEARKALSAKLHADRCLGEATLDLIAEVSRLNNGGPEKTAAASIAAHVEQLQPLARSYGYRITKPSMIALVVPL